MKQVKIIQAKKSLEELEALVNAFYAECEIKGFKILTSGLLSRRKPYCMQIIYRIDEHGANKFSKSNK